MSLNGRDIAWTILLVTACKTSNASTQLTAITDDVAIRSIFAAARSTSFYFHLYCKLHNKH